MKPKEIMMKMKQHRYTKYLIVFFVVFFISFSANYLLIYDLVNHIDDKQVSYVDFIVSDTYISDNGTHDFIIISNDNQTYEIINDKDGVDMYNKIEKNHHYYFVIRNDSNCEYPHIIQVHNERK